MVNRAYKDRTFLKVTAMTSVVSCWFPVGEQADKII